MHCAALVWLRVRGAGLTTTRCLARGRWHPVRLCGDGRGASRAGPQGGWGGRWPWRWSGFVSYPALASLGIGLPGPGGAAATRPRFSFVAPEPDTGYPLTGAPNQS